MGTVLRMVAMYMVMSYLRPAAKAPLGPGGLAVTVSKSLPKFQKGYLLDMYVFLSEQQAMRHYDMSELIWSETGIELGNTKEKRSYTVKYEPSKVSSITSRSLRHLTDQLGLWLTDVSFVCLQHEPPCVSMRHEPGLCVPWLCSFGHYHHDLAFAELERVHMKWQLRVPL